MNSNWFDACAIVQAHEEEREEEGAGSTMGVMEFEGANETQATSSGGLDEPLGGSSSESISTSLLSWALAESDETQDSPSQTGHYSSCKAHQAVPFVKNEETFTVPVGLPEKMWAPGKPLRISYVSWNMGHKSPNLGEVAKYCIHPNAHIVVVCTQENGKRLLVKKDRNEWEKHVARTCLLEKYVLLGRKELWYIQLLVYVRRKDVASYIRCIGTTSVKTGVARGLCGNKGGVAVALSISMTPAPLQTRSERLSSKTASSFRDRMKSCSPPVKVGRGAAKVREEAPLGGKEASNITLLFIGAHLAAHQKGVQMRNKDYLSIVKGMYAAFQKSPGFFWRKHVVPKGHANDSADGLESVGGGEDEEASLPQCVSDAGSEGVSFGGDEDTSLLGVPPAEAQAASPLYHDVTEEFDLVFFGGDLNYRINGTRGGIECLIGGSKYIRFVLADCDQLNIERAKGLVFRRFREGKLFFRPTYKYEIEQDVYNYTNKTDRRPAYCDRVLYKKGRESRAGKVKISLYTDVPQVRTSDHRPVVAIFDVATHVYRPS
ncbi:endonuclease/Exonuclease/phosphatase [Trypanosoma conorhini]|uniref:Endonuclease/Exonuclease/phosphatase n=1 Tax=Trypanosoma conorhini TaxID=83891 RepID=A0A3R7MN07_9TRYP|nr:endonuclease/Exonuclease/phosphatase [Trypanosoma conorhini]RNF17903.1 endonuclease/Exonuclease/phosphatase [Trypanosoma conorhini]